MRRCYRSCHCQALIGSGASQGEVEQGQAVDEAMELIEASGAMPPWAKEMALSNIDQVDFAEMRRAQVDALVRILNINGLQEASARQGVPGDAPQAAIP